MKVMTLEHPADFAAWRAAAKACLAEGRLPEDIQWGDGTAMPNLFGGEPGRHSATPVTATKVPQAFVDLAQRVICHRDPERHALLYRLLWRLQSSPGLLQDSADLDVHRLTVLAKAVARDMHKMKAFVRFREIPVQTEDKAGAPAYIAWFEPAHHIVEATAPFFQRRFTGMCWSILTPDRSAHWDGTALSFGAGASQHDVPDTDRLEDYWRTYYAHIFNPARLKTRAMTAEMPKKYWKNLPEAPLIDPLIRSAQARSSAMIAAEAAPARPNMRPAPAVTYREAAPRTRAMTRLETLGNLKAALNNCRACPLYKDATQGVPGAGPAPAPLMLVGEQPGDQEDLAGAPFVGPAGQLLDQALKDAGIDRTKVYVTNAVKHFKFAPRGKRRLHQKPSTGEIDTCRRWLEEERRLVRPQVTVALGATAARGVFGQTVVIGANRGRPKPMPGGAKGLITIHPSYLLRLPGPEAAAKAYAAFVADLSRAKALATA